MFLAFLQTKSALAVLAAGALIAAVPLAAGAQSYDYDRASHYRTGDSGTYRREPTTASHYWDHVARAYAARGYGYGYGYYRSCGCYRDYYAGHRYRNSGPELYDYQAQVFDDRTRLDRRTQYEYRWPRRNY